MASAIVQCEQRLSNYVDVVSMVTQTHTMTSLALTQHYTSDVDTNASVKGRSHLASMFPFAFSKTIEAMITKHKCKEWMQTILCINIKNNVPIDTMLKFDANTNKDFDVYANCERTSSDTNPYKRYLL